MFRAFRHRMLGECDTVIGFVIVTELHFDALEAQHDVEWNVQTEAAEKLLPTKTKSTKKNSITIDHAHFQNSLEVGMPLAPCAGHSGATKCTIGLGFFKMVPKANRSEQYFKYSKLETLVKGSLQYSSTLPTWSLHSLKWYQRQIAVNSILSIPSLKHW